MLSNTPQTATRTARLTVRTIRSTTSLRSLSEFVAKKKYPAILGGNHCENKHNRYSIFAAEPIDTVVFLQKEKEPFVRLSEALDRYRLESPVADSVPAGMFCGGWIGYFSYDLDQYIERIDKTATDDLKLPLIRLCFYDKTICYDHFQQLFFLIALDFGDDAQGKLDQMESWLDAAATTEPAMFTRPDLTSVSVDELHGNMTRSDYEAALEKIERYIYDGEVYQINFSQRFHAPFTARPVALYQWQNQHNPCPYAAYIDAGNFAIVSASPELFIRVQGRSIWTRPIKGTRPRITSGPDADKVNHRQIEELMTSEKERAELNMIIDLERNDITRVCEYGTIHVVEPRSIEAYPTVYHALATIRGRLRNTMSGQTFCEIMKAMFPGGSITGAPKVRAMEIIDELEPTQRSVYTGGIGYIGIDGNVCLNIAIRTIILCNGRAYVQTGGGIVADSVTQAEWDETITKARALLAGIAAVNRPQ